MVTSKIYGIAFLWHEGFFSYLAHFMALVSFYTPWKHVFQGYRKEIKGMKWVNKNKPRSTETIIKGYVLLIDIYFEASQGKVCLLQEMRSTSQKRGRKSPCPLPNYPWIVLKRSKKFEYFWNFQTTAAALGLQIYR